MTLGHLIFNIIASLDERLALLKQLSNQPFLFILVLTISLPKNIFLNLPSAPKNPNEDKKKKNGKLPSGQQRKYI